MVCYIKDKYNFVNKTMYQLADYDYFEHTIDDDKSTFTIIGDVKNINGDYLIFNGHPWVITGTSPDSKKNITKITCDDIINAFDRDLVFSGSVSAPETFISGVLTSEYKSVTDIMYAMPYLSILTSSATTVSINPDVDSNNVYSLKEYIEKTRRIQNIFVEFTVDKNVLKVDIGKKSIAIRNVDFSSTRYRLTGETYSDSAVGRITAYCEEDSSTSNWFLLLDGTVSSTYIANNRVDGEWKKIFVQKLEDVESSVQDEFEKNKYSHLIEFSSSDELNFFDHVNIGINGDVLSSYVSAIEKTKKSSEIQYRTGELKKTLVGKLRRKI